MSVYNLIWCLCHLEDAGGVGLLPYLKAAKGCLRVTGLPDGIGLRKANLYGLDQMRKILNAADNICIEIGE